MIHSTCTIWTDFIPLCFLILCLSRALLGFLILASSQTSLTFIGVFSCMSFHMALQITTGPTCKITSITFKLCLSCMYSHMSHQITVLITCKITKIAFIGLLSCMYSHMYLQTIAMITCKITNSTCIRLLSCVHCLVQYFNVFKLILQFTCLITYGLIFLLYVFSYYV